jgi:hypothetical protein
VPLGGTPQYEQIEGDWPPIDMDYTKAYRQAGLAAVRFERRQVAAMQDRPSFHPGAHSLGSSPTALKSRGLGVCEALEMNRPAAYVANRLLYRIAPAVHMYT